MSDHPDPYPTADDVPPDALDAGLAAAFGPDSEPPVVGGSSVLEALGASLPQLPRVQLRELSTEEAVTPVNLPGSSEMPDPRGRTPSARLQLVGEIARGGMGAVLKGRDVDLGRDLAVKVLLEKHKGKAELVRRFVEEAQISGQLQHPGVVPLYELGQFPDRRPYFTMKLVKGRTLAALLVVRKDVEEDRPKFLGVFEQVCQTLAYAHARGVIHRDLKPANVMVGAFGEVQVMDWGLAKVLAEGGVADEERASRSRPTPDTVSVIRTRRSDGAGTAEGFGSHTQAGAVLGTPQYMAPEQARGDVELVDERADVFGLGGILCEVLTGAPPFPGTKAEAQRKAETAQLGDAHARLDGCGADAALVALAKRCLAAEPWDRPRDAGEVAAAVTAYQHAVRERLRQAELERAAAEARAEEEARTRQMAEAKAAEERKRRRVTLALAAAVLLMVLVGGGGAAWWWQERTAVVSDVEAALDEAAKHQAKNDWPEVRSALARAAGRLRGWSGPAGLRDRVRQAQADADMVAKLDEIRLRMAGGKEEKAFDYAAADASYAAAFQEYGIDLAELDVTLLISLRENAITKEPGLS
jgi:eukaryotic-like serine/threonine-protein kinase